MRAKREVYSNTSLPQQTRETSHIQPNLTCKATRKRKTKPKVTRKKEMRQIRVEINEIETKNPKKRSIKYHLALANSFNPSG